jgi:hypothetical protein
MVTEMLATPLGSWLLSKDLWLPYMFAVPVWLSSFLIVLALPETLLVKPVASSSDDHSRTSTIIVGSKVLHMLVFHSGLLLN